MSREGAVRVLIGGPQQILRSAIEGYLAQRPEFHVVGQAADAKALLIEAEACRPDVVLIDWDRFNGELKETVTALHLQEPRPTIVALTAFSDTERAARAAGADGTVSKSDPPRSLLTAIYRARMEGDE